MKGGREEKGNRPVRHMTAPQGHPVSCWTPTWDPRACWVVEGGVVGRGSGGGRAGVGLRRVEVDGVKWFVRANELSFVNRGLMGYPGSSNLIRELERVGLNVRHT